MLSKISNWWDKIPFNTILTPHPKEMSRLTRLPVSEIQSDRLNVAKRFSEQWGVIVVLKGANTVICDPNGSSIISPFANPILSSAGTGDVLAGLITGFIGQGSRPLEASSLGVYIHGKTAESVSLQIGPSGLLATELANNVPFTIKYLRN
jgi:NAD(P)H-hydrate epimerase